MNKFLYEQLMNDLSKNLEYTINEAYNNTLLEQYNFKDFLNKSIEYCIKKLKDLPEDEVIDKKINQQLLIIKQIIINTIKEIQKTHGYKNAVIYVNEIKKQLTNIIKAGKKLTPKDFVKIIKNAALVTGLLTTVVLANIINTSLDEIKNGSKNIENIEQSYNTDYNIDDDALDIPLTTNDNNTVTTKTSNLKNAVPNNFGITPSKFDKAHNITMQPSKECVKFIQNDEVLCLFPYYATRKEKADGKITIGWGHVICDNWKSSTSAWYFPKNMSDKQKKQLKAQIIKLAKSNIIKISLVGTQNGKLVNVNKDSRMKDIITKQLAQEFFKQDILTADRRVKITLGKQKSAAGKFQNNSNIDDNVKNYCYYNQNIYDALISCAFNSGGMFQSTPIVSNLLKCRYDYSKNHIETGDFNVTMQSFKKGNGANTDRRTKEYYTFINKKGTLDNFDNVIKKLKI